MKQLDLDHQRAVAREMKEMVDDFEHPYGYWSGVVGHIVVQDYNFDVQNILNELITYYTPFGDLSPEGERNKCEDYGASSYTTLYFLLHDLLKIAFEQRWWTIWETRGIVHDEWISLEQLVAWRNAHQEPEVVK